MANVIFGLTTTRPFVSTKLPKKFLIVSRGEKISKGYRRTTDDGKLI